MSCRDVSRSDVFASPASGWRLLGGTAPRSRGGGRARSAAGGGRPIGENDEARRAAACKPSGGATPFFSWSQKAPSLHHRCNGLANFILMERSTGPPRIRVIQSGERWAITALRRTPHVQSWKRAAKQRRFEYEFKSDLAAGSRMIRSGRFIPGASSHTTSLTDNRPSRANVDCRRGQAARLHPLS